MGSQRVRHNQATNTSTSCSKKQATLAWTHSERIGGSVGWCFSRMPRGAITAPDGSHSLGGTTQGIALPEWGSGRQVGVPQSHLCSLLIFQHPSVWVDSVAKARGLQAEGGFSLSFLGSGGVGAYLTTKPGETLSHSRGAAASTLPCWHPGHPLSWWTGAPSSTSDFLSCLSHS